MKVRYSLLLFVSAVAVLQLMEVANAAAFVCRADITTQRGLQKEVSGWINAESAQRANQAWLSRVRGEHRPRHVAAPRCSLVRSISRG